MVSSRAYSVYTSLALFSAHQFPTSSAFSTSGLSPKKVPKKTDRQWPGSFLQTRPPQRRISSHVLNVATNPFKDKQLPYFEDASSLVVPKSPVQDSILQDETQFMPKDLVDFHPTQTSSEQESTYPPMIESILSSYLGPRLVLALVSVLYATNFPLGALMNDNLPASAATSSRMVLASLVLSPFLFQLKPSLRYQILLCGSFVSLGYVSQSIALVDTSPALVSFLGSATVLVCPILQWAVDKKPMGYKEAPQTWLAAILCLMGVASLELFGGGITLEEHVSQLGMGDVLSLVQAVGFGTGVFLSERMMKKEPDQALPITAGLVGVTAFYAMMWCFVDGWMERPGWESFGLPGLFMDPDLRMVAYAVAWTGILSTSTNFFIEITALGRVPSSEASVILATEPLWASLFAALVFHEQFGVNDYVGGMLMIGACLVNTLKPEDFGRWFESSSDKKVIDASSVIE